MIEELKQKINQLDAGTFQNLCNSILYEEKHVNSIILGGKPGESKTTRGTPDIYYYLQYEQKYVFVECTTQKTRIFDKIKADIKKCFDIQKTGIPIEQISEVIYFHTSANLTPLQDATIRRIGESLKVQITLIGIDSIAEILFKYPILQKEYLNINIDTQQVLTCDAFIKAYNRNNTSAPLYSDFWFRDEEKNKIKEAFNVVDIVILRGHAGVGKTRLALEFSKEYSKANGYKLYCLKNRSLSIYDDLMRYLNNPDKYFILLDDANQFTNIKNIVEYIMECPNGLSIKLLLTVRDYAFKSLVNEIKSVNDKVLDIPIGEFSDSEIVKLLYELFDIRNSRYQKKIVQLSHGNARLAILAGKIVIETNSLSSISDVSNLYDNYYGIFLPHYNFLQNEKTCKCLGILSILGTLNFDNLSELEILKTFDIEVSEFIREIKQLHELEIVDIRYDKIAQITDQCLENYFLKFVLFEKKYLDIALIIDTCFAHYRKRLVYVINTLLNIFYNKELENYIETAIKNKWKSLEENKDPCFYDYVGTFFRVNPIGTLSLLDDLIENEKKEYFTVPDIETNSISIEEPRNFIFRIIGGFSDMLALPDALDLFFKFYLKRPDLYIEAYKTICYSYGITLQSSTNGYKTQDLLFKNFSEYSESWKNENIVKLYLSVAKKYLALLFHTSELGKDGRTVYFNTIMVQEEANVYRKMIWEALIEIHRENNCIDYLKSLLLGYGCDNDILPEGVILSDFRYIEYILNNFFTEFSLSNIFIAEHLNDFFQKANIETNNVFSLYLEQKAYKIYKQIINLDYEKGTSHTKRYEIREKRIKDFLKDFDFDEIRYIVDLSAQLIILNSSKKYLVKEVISCLANIVFTNYTDNYFDLIKYCIQKGLIEELALCQLIANLFKITDPEKVFSLIDFVEYKDQNIMIYAFYHELPQDKIKEEHIKGLYSFLNDTSDKYISSGSYRDVFFLEKYSILDPDIFINGCEIIFNKRTYSLFIVDLYCECLFLNFPPAIIDTKFEARQDLLIDIYFELLFSYDIDCNGTFLLWFYKKDASILTRFVDYLCQNNDKLNNEGSLLSCFFELDSYIDIYTNVFNHIIQSVRFPEILAPEFFGIIIGERDKKIELQQDLLIRSYIENFSTDRLKMSILFGEISRFYNHRKKDYILLFLHYNPNFNDFVELPFTPQQFSYSSLIPILEKRIELFYSLINDLKGIKWIQHKKYLEEKIGDLRQQIKKEEIEEYFDGS